MINKSDIELVMEEILELRSAKSELEDSVLTMNLQLRRLYERLIDLAEQEVCEDD